MTPKSDSSQSKSGNPATQQSIKEQRAAKRDAKVAAYKAEQARKARNKRIGIGAGVVGGVLVVALLVVSIIVTWPQPRAEYEAGSAGAEVEGVETFSNTNQHTQDPVEYEQTPPAGGDHNPIWLNCGVYTEPVPNENAVHSLEHGAVWLTYDPEQLSQEEIDQLEAFMPSTYAIFSPYEGMDTPIAVSAWNAQLKVDDPGDERIAEFFEEYWRSNSVPEPNAACTGGVDA